MIPQKDEGVQIFPKMSNSKRSLSGHQNFRIRSVSRTKYENPKQSKIIKVENGVRAEAHHIRSRSLKLVRKCRYQTKQTEANVDSQDEEKIVGKRNLKTEETQIEILKKREIAKIFNPKTIMKLSRRNSQFSQDDNYKQRHKEETKQKFRLKKYFVENSQLTEREKKAPESSKDYWRRVNESLILAQDQNDEISKDLRELYDEI